MSAAEPQLDETDLRAALFAVSELLRHRPSAPASLWAVRDKLDSAIRSTVSRRGQECCCGEAELEHVEWIGTRLAAATLGWGTRRVRRHRDALGGQLVGDRLVFDAAAIREHAEALSQNGERNND